MADPYQILGVTREATQDEIRKAYRRLAKKNHPDLHPGDKGAEARFKEIASAYDIVGDEKKRARFDSGEIDASGAERQQPEREFYRQHAEARPGVQVRAPLGAGADHEDGGSVRRAFRPARARTKARGPDVHYTFSVEFIEAINGAKKRVVMADGKALDITIPAGLKDGQTLRLRGQGHPGVGGAEPGDALVEIHVKPHPIFRRDGNNIRSMLPVTPGEALGGAKVRVETVSGPSISPSRKDQIPARSCGCAARACRRVVGKAIISWSCRSFSPTTPTMSSSGASRNGKPSIPTIPARGRGHGHDQRERACRR